MSQRTMIDESEPKPQCQITYAALRAAFVTTLDNLLRYSLDPSSCWERPRELFDCFPTLKGTAPQVQLECLFRTWNRWNQQQTGDSDLLDDCIFFAAYETLARIASEKQERTLQVVLSGPGQLPPVADHWLIAKTRCIQMAAPRALSSRLLRKLTDIADPVPWLDRPPAIETEEGEDDLLDLVGRWTAQRDLVLGSKGLLTEDEQDILRAFFEEHPGLIR